MLAEIAADGSAAARPPTSSHESGRKSEPFCVSSLPGSSSERSQPRRASGSTRLDSGHRTVATLLVNTEAAINGTVAARSCRRWRRSRGRGRPRAAEGGGARGGALRRSDSLKTSLLRSVSHDIRSPLTAILASAGALANAELDLDDDDRRALTRASARRPSASTASSATCSTSRGTRRARPSRTAGYGGENELVGQALEGVRGGADRVIVELSADGPAIRDNAAPIERALANPIKNALESAMRLAGGRVAEHGATGCGSTSSTAAPVSRPKREAVSRALRRGERAAGGVRGGESAARSRAASPKRTAAISGRRTTGPADTSCSRSRRRSGRRYGHEQVLVVDDEPRSCAPADELRGAGYDVETEDTAEGALTALAVNPPDAVVLTSCSRTAADQRPPQAADVERDAGDGPLGRRRGSRKGGRARRRHRRLVTKPFGIEELLARLRPRCGGSTRRPSRW